MQIAVAPTVSQRLMCVACESEGRIIVTVLSVSAVRRSMKAMMVLAVASTLSLMAIMTSTVPTMTTLMMSKLAMVRSGDVGSFDKTERKKKTNENFQNSLEQYVGDDTSRRLHASTSLAHCCHYTRTSWNSFQDVIKFGNLPSRGKGQGKAFTRYQDDIEMDAMK